MSILFISFIYLCKAINFPVRFLTGKDARWFDRINNIG